MELRVLGVGNVGKVVGHRTCTRVKPISSLSRPIAREHWDPF